MVVVVVVEKVIDEGAALDDRAESFWEPWRIFEGLELGFAVGVVVGDIPAWRYYRSISASRSATSSRIACA